MPLFLAIVAIFVILTAIKGNYQAVGQQAQQTFFGSNGQSGFLVWFGSLLGLALVFRVINAPKAGELFIALLILVYFLQNQGVLATLESTVQSAGAASTTGASTTGSTPTGASASGPSTTGSTPQ